MSKILADSNFLKTYSRTIFTISIVLICVFVSKSYLRINAWKNNETLLISTIKTNPSYLYKGFRTKDLAHELLKTGEKNQGERLLKIAYKYFNKAIDYYRDTNKHQLNEPEILKVYGLDNKSLLIKSIYQLCFEQFSNKRGSYKECLKLFEPHIKDIDSFDPWTLELYANLLIEKGDVKGGKEVFLYAYEKYPNIPFIFTSLIRFERDIENNLINTKKYLSGALKLYPYAKEYLFESLRYYQKTGELADYVESSYLYGLRAHSKFTYLEALTGYLALGNLEKAKKTIDKLLKSDPNDPKVHYMASNYYIKQKDYKNAILELLQAHAFLDKTQIDLGFKITNTLANLHIQQNNFPEALLYTKEALSYAKGNPDNIEKVKKLVERLGI